MKRLLPFLLLTLAVPFLLASAQEGGEPPLGRSMQELKSTLEKIEGALDGDEPDFALLLTDVCRLEQVALEAKSFEPRMFERLKDDEKKLAKAKLSYRAQMQDLVRALLDLEMAVAEEDGKAAKKAVREVSKVQDKGHGEFRPRGGGR